MTLDELAEVAETWEEEDEWSPEDDLWEALGHLKDVYDLLATGDHHLKRLPAPFHKKVMKAKAEVAEFLMQYDLEEEESVT